MSSYFILHIFFIHTDVLGLVWPHNWKIKYIFFCSYYCWYFPLVKNFPPKTMLFPVYNYIRTLDIEFRFFLQRIFLLFVDGFFFAGSTVGFSENNFLMVQVFIDLWFLKIFHSFISCVIFQMIKVRFFQMKVKNKDTFVLGLLASQSMEQYTVAKSTNKRILLFFP